MLMEPLIQSVKEEMGVKSFMWCAVQTFLGFGTQGQQRIGEDKVKKFCFVYFSA